MFDAPIRRERWSVLMLPTIMRGVQRQRCWKRGSCCVPIPPSRPSTISLRGEEKSQEFCREETEDKSEAGAGVRSHLAWRRPIRLRWQEIPAHAPSRVCDYGTDRYRKEAARGVSRERKIIYGSERGRKIILQGKTTRSSLTAQRLRERRGTGSGG